jgi:hypothetical protein
MHLTQISPTRTAASVFFVGLACLICSPFIAAQEADDPGEVVATVNGKPIFAKHVVADETGLRRPLEVAINNLLIGQQAAKEGLEAPTTKPRLEKMLAQVKQQETGMLVNMYQKKMLASIENPLTAAEIEAYQAEHADYIATTNPNLNEEETRKVAIRMCKADAYGDRLRGLFSNARVSINGESIPPAILDHVVASVVSSHRGRHRVQRGSTPVYDGIREFVLAREAQARGVEPAALAADPELVEELMATAVLGVDGQDMIIGTRPHWKVGITTGNAEWVIVTTLKGQVLATEARQQDFLTRTPSSRKERPGSRHKERVSRTL